MRRGMLVVVLSAMAWTAPAQAQVKGCTTSAEQVSCAKTIGVMRFQASCTTAGGCAISEKTTAVDVNRCAHRSGENWTETVCETGLTLRGKQIGRRFCQENTYYDDERYQRCTTVAGVDGVATLDDGCWSNPEHPVWDPTWSCGTSVTTPVGSVSCLSRVGMNEGGAAQPRYDWCGAGVAGTMVTACSSNPSESRVPCPPIRQAP